MKVEMTRWGGAVTTRGDLTGPERIARINTPLMTIHIDPSEMAEEPEGWVEPVYSDAFIEVATEAFREWLLSLR